MTLLTGLRVNYLDKPLGVEISRPVVFSWRMESSLIGQRQMAYRVVVAEESGVVVWDSGKVESGVSVGIVCGAEALRVQTKYLWTVTVWDKDGAIVDAGSFFETGTTWDGARWITIKDYASDMRSLLFRTERAIEAKNIVSARLYITGLGAYEAFVNGKRVGDSILAPGWSDYTSYVHYQTYDVTDCMASGLGTVTIGAIVGSGWYGSSIVDAKAIGYDTIFGETDMLERCLFAKLVITYDDGTQQEIITDTENWRVSTQSPYQQDGIYEGETYNALTAEAIRGWACAGYDVAHWGQAYSLGYKGAVVAGCGGMIYDYRSIPLKSAYSYNGDADIVSSGASDVNSDIVAAGDYSAFAKGEIDFSQAKHYGPDDIIRLKAGDTLITDFHQNAAATVAMKVVASSGTVITMVPGEKLSDGKDGEFAKGTLMPGACKGRGFCYIASGNGVEIYRSRFHFTGYQYLEITATEDIEIHSLSSIAVSSVGEETGFVETSNDLLNRFILSSKWSQASNFNSVPTDCPHREYYGWSGDAQIFAETAMYHFDCTQILGNYIDIMNDYQRTYGQYGPIMPMHNNSQYAKMIGAGWADAGIIIPWVYYVQTGDIVPAKVYWPDLCKYTDFINTKGHTFSHGDWCGGNERCGMPFIMLCYSTYINLLMEEMAKAIGNKADASKYQQNAEQKRRQIIERYVTPEGNIRCASVDQEAGNPMIDSQRATCVDNAQTALAWAILLKLYDTKAQRQTIIENLVKSVQNKNQSISKDRGENTLSTGFLGVHVLLPALSEGGRSDIAYDLMLNTDMYTFLYQIKKGATTTWERWDIWTKEKGYTTDEASHNHYSYGAASEWVYKYLLGIQRDKAAPGFKHFILQPQANPALDYAKGSYKSYYGTIEVSWTANNGAMTTYHCTVPANTTATLHLPIKDAYKVGELPEDVVFERSNHKGSPTAVFALPSGRFGFKIEDGAITCIAEKR